MLLKVVFDFPSFDRLFFKLCYEIIILSSLKQDFFISEFLEKEQK